MRLAFFAVVTIHAFMHLLGFVKAFHIFEVRQLTQHISKTGGFLWLLASLLLLAASVLFLLKVKWWWLLSLVALVLSQYLIFTSWQDAKFGAIINILLLLVTIVGFASWKFSKRYESDVQSHLNQFQPTKEEMLTASDIQHLPTPIQKYLHTVNAVGKPKVNNFRVTFSGQIRKDEQSPWMPFKSEQYNFMESTTRLFFLNATLKGLPVAGYHRYENGQALMDIRLFSLFKIQYQSGPQMDIAEAVTFFNDMCCMAPATLIDKRITWLETDGNKVKASFTVNDITITAWLHFNESGMLVNFTSEDRYAQMDDGTMKQFPWSTPAQDISEVNGQLIGSKADAVYSYPEGNFVYGTFQLTDVEYNLKQTQK